MRVQWKMIRCRLGGRGVGVDVGAGTGVGGGGVAARSLPPASDLVPYGSSSSSTTG